MSSTSKRRVRTATGTALLLAVLSLFGNVGEASAHAELVSTDPAEGAVLPEGPQQVHLTFGDTVDPGVASVQVTGSDGTHWESGPAQGAGSSLIEHLRPQAPAGQYTVNYRVVSDDGHPVTGMVRFTVGSPGGPASGASPAAPAPAQATTSTSDDLPIWPWAVVAVVLVGLATAITVRIRRSRL